jgi:hypothetical protein
MPLPKINELLDEATSQAAPTASGDGVQIPAGVNSCDLILQSTAGSGTMTALIRIWLYSNLLDVWVPASIGTGAATSNTSGVLNDGSAIEEISADLLSHYERLTNLETFDRIAAEVITLGGTATAVDLDAVWHAAANVRL